jgi:AcrR family transcriptional regulator
MTRHLSEDEMLDLTRQATVRNMRLGITGALFCSSDRYIQVLEGPTDAVGRVYRSIRDDPRHMDVITVVDAPIDGRSFDDWSMRLLGVDDLSPTEQAVVVEALRSVDPESLRPRRAWTTRDLLSGPLGGSLAQAFRETPRSPHDLEVVDRLLEAVETFLLRELGLTDHTLDSVALVAGVAPLTARRPFRDLNDLVAAGVRRLLAVEHSDFLEVMTSHAFESRADITFAIVEFLTRTTEARPELPSSLNAMIRRQAAAFASQSAWPLADAICAASDRPGWPCPDMEVEALALGLTATAAALGAFLEHGPGEAGGPPVEQRLLKICEAALASA